MKKFICVVGLCILSSYCSIAMDQGNKVRIEDDAMDLDEPAEIAPAVRTVEELLVELGANQDRIELYQGLCNRWSADEMSEIISTIEDKPQRHELISGLMSFAIKLVEDELQRKTIDNSGYLLEQEPLEEKSVRTVTMLQILTLLLNADYFKDRARLQPLTLLFLKTCSQQNKSTQKAIARYFMAKLSSKAVVHSICELIAAENENAALQCLETAPVLADDDRDWVVEWAILFGRSRVLAFFNHKMSRREITFYAQKRTVIHDFAKMLIYRGSADALRQCLSREAYEALLMTFPEKCSLQDRKHLDTWFQFFVYVGYTECIRSVLQMEPPFNFPVKHYREALSLAIEEEQDAIVELLATMPNSRTIFKKGLSPELKRSMQIACEKRNLPGLKALLKK